MIFVPSYKEGNQSITAAVIVAHPDDEVLWAGGMMLLHPEYKWYIIAMCRASDADRAPKFFKALEELGAEGNIADLDDGPDQIPLSITSIQETILSLLPERKCNILFTHNLYGEYTYHRRHIETSTAVVNLWGANEISAETLCFFAYEDGGKKYLPRAEKNAHIQNILPENIWQEKYKIITETYNFGENSWEARTTPKVEAFWCFNNTKEVENWLKKEES